MWIVQRVDQPRSRIAWLARCLLNRSVIKSLAKWLVEFWPWKTTNKMLGIAWCSGGNSLCFHGIKGKGWWARPKAFSSDISLSHWGNLGDEKLVVALQISSLADSGDYGQPLAAVIWLCVVHKLSCTSCLFPHHYLLLWYDGGTPASGIAGYVGLWSKDVKRLVI